MRSGTLLRTVFQGDFDRDRAGELDFVATRHGLWVLQAGSSKLDRLRAANPDLLALRYFKIGGVHGPETRPPDGDPHWAATSQRDLFARDETGQPVRNVENGWFYVDLVDPARRAAWIEILLARLAEDLAGYDGVMLDNSGVIHPTLFSSPPADYRPEPYYAAVREILKRVKDAFPTKTLVINSYAGWAPEGQRGLELLEVADGLYFESFAYRVSGAFFTRARLMQQLGDFAAVGASGKIAVALDYAPPEDRQRRMLSLATYLLGAGESSYYFFSGRGVDRSAQEYPEQRLDLGRPLGAMSQRPDGLVSRSYERGLVLMNPNPDGELVFAGWPGGAESLALSGGGAFPNPGTLEWLRIPAPVNLPSMSAVVIRPLGSGRAARNDPSPPRSPAIRRLSWPRHGPGPTARAHS